jgi:hypothetical protein
MQEGEAVVYDMDIEILDSYPTIELIGKTFYRNLQYLIPIFRVIITILNIGIFRYCATRFISYIRTVHKSLVLAPAA